MIFYRSTATKTGRPSSAPIDFSRASKNLKILLVDPFVEIYYGIKSDRLPYMQCLLASSIIQLIILLALDARFFELLGVGDFYPMGEAGTFYRTLATFSPFLSWGFYHALLKVRLVRRLTQVFRDSKLVSATGKLPSFIHDKAIDEFNRVMKLAKNGITEKKFKEEKESLESGLQVFIDEIAENRVKNTVDISYSHKPLINFHEIQDVEGIDNGTFLVGKGRTNNVKSKLTDVPHLLVAGQTGMGKSTFLRQYICSLYLNNDNFTFDLVDLKEKLEFAIWDGLPRVTVRSTIKSAIDLLKKLSTQVIAQRSQLLLANDCKDIGSFLKIPVKDRKFPEGVSTSINLDRHIVVVDEAFDLFMKGPSTSSESITDARRYASKVAAQGRAVGVHMVLATQRPDRFAIDPATKANLTGKVIFRVPNHATSMTVLDSKRAAELPNTKGRAIWQDSSETVEVQTPFLSEDWVIDRLKPIKEQFAKANSFQTPKKQTGAQEIAAHKEARNGKK